MGYGVMSALRLRSADKAAAILFLFVFARVNQVLRIKVYKSMDFLTFSLMILSKSSLL